MTSKLLYIKKELNQHHRDKKQLEKYYIQKRLNDTLNAYYYDLEYSIKYLSNRKSENVFKQMEN